ncbi:MAG: F-type H+-transporting ATPase subunit epsilon [Parcubacteria group bacterium Gr01-1014_31]|nr:MAG: F-type H+-transporting ATPase subunit epsilon [Parcubacteria group bacterium Gr01-1014_31]
MATIKFKIATPERLVLETEADSISVPTVQGEITVLPNHVPLVAALEPGELTIRKGSDVQHLAVAGGFLQVQGGDEVVVLADAAERVEEIDVARAEAAKQRAAKLQTEAADDRQFADRAAQLAKHLARLRVARRRRAPHTGQEGDSLRTEGTPPPA